MKKKASELEFISQINRDGSGTRKVSESYIDLMVSRPCPELFELNSLSITNGTYIASGFNSFVVKLKDPA